MSDHCWVGLDAGHQDLGDVERAASSLADVIGCALEVCTHIIPVPSPHYAASLRLPRGRWAPAGTGSLLALGEGAIVVEGMGSTLEVGDAEARAGARAAIAAHAGGTGGRAIRFAGQDGLRGAMTVEDLLAGSAIDDVLVLGGEECPGSRGTGSRGTGSRGTGSRGTGSRGTGSRGTGSRGTGSVVETRDYVRPQYSCGALVLVLTPLGQGRLQPFEVEKAHQCCGGH